MSETVVDKHPLFQGSPPAREELQHDRPTYLPTPNNRPLLAFCGHLYRMQYLAMKKGTTNWFCVHSPVCRARVTTKDQYRPGDRCTELVGDVRGLHLCSPSPIDVLFCRAKAEIAWNTDQTELPPEEILKNVFDKESDAVQKLLGNRGLLQIKIDQNRVMSKYRRSVDTINRLSSSSSNGIESALDNGADNLDNFDYLFTTNPENSTCAETAVHFRRLQERR